MHYKSGRRDVQLTFRLPKRLRAEIERDANIHRCSAADVLVALLHKRYAKPRPFLDGIESLMRSGNG